ncbi:MAG: transcription termination/antitermination protein NusG [Candidatus Omnitrophica bacterium]|jgi:transcriptional antiterminator NusG|nr:transcription termination/antitermination protein NusG [Candidatus Omnitrophota bacterium]MCF7891743.1 transcription termination/antitermination protein NusG [Candidatus Omnitrophota bacterium]MCF7896170.1 transcription termination/antitermination protein NusG [Candidatus Omnitrophota bacterium]MCF7897656.1 transcription termination/antitermination protein NusG [Candidatus Omnitrophota bacterium]MCF7909444.1 transcription termination/antitermination protein NusG [Candidatus Omnitrophota bact
MHKWYIVHTLSGAEEKAKWNLEAKIKAHSYGELIDEIVIPKEQVTEVKFGKKKVLERKFFPGYILVHMEMNKDTWLFVKNTPGITTFIGPRKKPSPISQQEVEQILSKAKESEAKPAPKVSFEKGESVRVGEGPFVNFTGIVDEVYPGKGKLKVSVSIFGRTTPVELEFWQVEKI